MYYTHKNWGGVFERLPRSEDNFDKCGTVFKVVEHPPKWEYMKKIGWEDKMYIDEEYLIYFIPIDHFISTTSVDDWL